jgi:hypothetical protein
MRRKLPIGASKSASNAAKAANENGGPRHGNHHVKLPFLHDEEPRPKVQPIQRSQDLLAPVLRQGIQPLPAGTALYARPWSCLARQAHGVLAPAFELIISDS